MGMLDALVIELRTYPVLGIKSKRSLDGEFVLFRIVFSERNNVEKESLSGSEIKR